MPGQVDWSGLLGPAILLAIWATGLIAAGLGYHYLSTRVCAVIETQLSQGGVVRDLLDWKAGLDFSQEMIDAGKSTALHTSQIALQDGRLGELELWRNGLPKDPSPDKAIGHHTHAPYVYHAEEITAPALVGYEGALPIYEQRVIGTKESYACRICSQPLSDPTYAGNGTGRVLGVKLT
jgi:hypothetical protein